MTSTLAAVTFDCEDALALAGFWSAVLDRPIDPDASSGFAAIGLAERQGTESTWMFLKVPEPKAAKNRCHVDLTVSDGDPEIEINRLIGLGAKHVADKDEWGHAWAVLQDPEGNEFCVSRLT